MDLVLFLKDRLEFAKYFYSNASQPFSKIVAAIENEDPPFVPEYDESGEPPYLQEWLDAKTGLQSVGLTALSMVASSLQLFLDDWVRLRHERRREEKRKRKHARGWFHAYRKIFEDVGLDIEGCPSNLELIEQAVLARNRGQHPGVLTMLQTTHSKSDLEKYPSPYFASEADQKIINFNGGELSWWLSPHVYVDEVKLEAVISEVEKLCEWLEAKSSYSTGA